VTQQRPKSPDDGRARKRAALTLGGIAAAAAVVVLLMLAFLHTSSGHPTIAGLPDDPSAPASSPASSSAAATPPSPRSSSSPTPTIASTPTTTTCPSTAPCALSGDGGHAVAAVNAYRAHHGLPAVTGSATKAAQTCALHDGDQSSCPSSYFWEPVPTLDGTAVLTRIGSRADGSWLLAPKLTSVAIGWAYVPGPGHSGQYECAILKGA
jgi:hypothetical protein